MGCCRPFTYASDRTTNGITATCNDENETAIKKNYPNGCAITSPNASDGTLEGFGFLIFPGLLKVCPAVLCLIAVSLGARLSKGFLGLRPPTDIALQTCIDRYHCINDPCRG